MGSETELGMALTVLKQSSIMDYWESLETLLVYVSNMSRYTEDEKYRKIRINNIHFQERIGRKNGCVDAMAAIHYRQIGDHYVFYQPNDIQTVGELQERYGELENFLQQELDDVKKTFLSLPLRHAENHDYVAVHAAACHNEIGRRPHNEDDEIIVDRFCGDSNSAFFGLYDGHGGRETVDYVVRSLHTTFERALLANPTGEPERILHDTYRETDGHVRRRNILQSGTTAVTVLSRKEPDGTHMLYVANVGDSRAVLCRGRQAIRLTIDHKPSLEEERKRITDAGGFVARGDRVNGVLAISRALGDHTLKPKEVVTASPYTRRIDVQDTDQFLILACDGLWDELSDQQAVDFLYEKYDELASENMHPNERLNKICCALVRESIDKGSMDNVTVMIVQLSK